MSRRLTASTAALLIAPPLFWAGNAVVARALVGDFPPLALSFARWALALLLILPFTARAVVAAWPALRGRWGLMFTISALGVGCYNSLQYLALQTSSAVNATLIGASGPIVTLLVGAAFFGSSVRRPQWVGAAISLVGVLVVIARGDPVNLARLQFDHGLIMLIATLAGASTPGCCDSAPADAVGAFLTVQIALGALMILPFALLEFQVTGSTAAPSSTNLAALLYVALLPSLVAYFCWDRGVVRAGAILPIYFVNLTPVFAGLLSFFILGEPIGVYHLIGGLLIVAGIHLASLSVRQAAVDTA